MNKDTKQNNPKELSEIKAYNLADKIWEEMKYNGKHLSLREVLLDREHKQQVHG